MREFTATELQGFEITLQQIVDKFKATRNSRSTMLEFGSAGSVERAEFDSLTVPDRYYHLQFLDKELFITCDFVQYQYPINKRSSKRLYHVCTAGYKPCFVSSRTFELPRGNQPYETRYTRYGNFYSIGEALSWYKKFLLDFIYVLEPTFKPQQSSLFDGGLY